MTILVFGKTGQVATELSRLPDVGCLNLKDADLTDLVACDDAIALYRPSSLINAAASTDVDRAEDDEHIAHLVNAQSPKAMVQACADIAIPFVHISTDYVFDDSGQEPWMPDARTCPQNSKGRTKLAGGTGSRLHPITIGVSKHLLPI